MLRGINVSGQKKIKMADLIAIYESLNFKNVETYIQSGNVIFKSSSKSTPGLSKNIETAIKEVFQFHVNAVVRTRDELRYLIEQNPYSHSSEIDLTKLHVTFLQTTPKISDVNDINVSEDKMDKFVINNNEIYLYCPNGYARTKFSNAFFEKKLKIPATTRNWKTINKLYTIADAIK